VISGKEAVEGYLEAMEKQARKTLKSILKQANLSVEEFVELL